MIHGIDLSHHNRVTDWRALASAVGFVYIRAAHGCTVDRAWANNWGAAGWTGLKRGAYLYLVDHEPYGAQAEFFCDLMSYAGQGELPPALDVEEGHPLPSDLRAVLEHVELQTGQRPAIYGSACVLSDLIGTDPEWARYPLWVADYGRPAGDPRLPKPWPSWWMHQHSATGRVPGVVGDVDLDVMETP